MRLSCQVLGTLLFAGGVLGAEPLTPKKVETDVRVENLRNRLQDLTDIASRNDGNRASGTPGYKAAVEYVVESLRAKTGSKELDVQIQSFTHPYDQTNEIKLTGPGGEALFVVSLSYNPSTPDGGITAELVDTPVDDKGGSGCHTESWASVNAKGKIALVKRGGCQIAEKVKLARASGALAVILYNQVPGPDILPATLGPDNQGKLLPVGVVTFETGAELKSRLSMGRAPPFTVTLVVDSITEEREAWNVIAETREGDPDSVVMLGAHLDTVKDGPGINDDGSGVAALLELAESFKKYQGFNNTVRFAFWGAEERGLLGSLYYSDNLTVELADHIRFYFNYDMIGSKKPKFSVQADTSADRVGASLLLKYITDHGQSGEFVRFGVNSDYVAFLQLGIPSSGIFTGGGEGFDSCYHKKCDTIDNINFEALLLNTKAAGHVAAKFALSVDDVPRRGRPDLLHGSMNLMRLGVQDV